MSTILPSAADSDDNVSAAEMDEFLRRPYESDEPDAAPCCSTCGAAIGHFIGYDGWHHFRGAGAVASPIELYDAGHEPVVAWRETASAGDAAPAWCAGGCDEPDHTHCGAITLDAQTTLVVARTSRGEVEAEVIGEPSPTAAEGTVVLSAAALARLAAVAASL